MLSRYQLAGPLLTKHKDLCYWEDGGNIGGSGIHFPSAPGKYLADLRSRANSQQYSSIYEDQRPKIEDIERSDGETTKPGVLKRLELDRVKHINVSSRPVSTGE